MTMYRNRTAAHELVLRVRGMDSSAESQRVVSTLYGCAVGDCVYA